jgi:hypothetical protein
MNRVIAIFLLSVFSLGILAMNYTAYKKGAKMTVTMVEEDETNHEILEVKKYIRQDEHPFEMFGMMEYKSSHLTEFTAKDYEDVHLSSLETPPDFMC